MFTPYDGGSKVATWIVNLYAKIRSGRWTFAYYDACWDVHKIFSGFSLCLFIQHIVNDILPVSLHFRFRKETNIYRCITKLNGSLVPTLPCRIMIFGTSEETRKCLIFSLLRHYLLNFAGRLKISSPGDLKESCERVIAYRQCWLPHS